MRILIVPISILGFFLLTGMTVVYDNETGKVQAIGPFVNYKTKAGQSLKEVPNAEPSQINDFIVDQSGEYRIKTVEEKNMDKADKLKEKNDRKAKKQALMNKLSISDAELKTLTELIKDGNEN